MRKLITVFPALTLLGIVVSAQDYVIGPQDVLAIAVYDQADLSGRFSVEGDGSLSFPLVGRVKAAGLTLRALELELQRLLADGYLKNPQVAIAIEQYRSQRVLVVGEVRTPGAYALTGDMTLLEVLSRAGSTTPAAGDEALIVRAQKGKEPSEDNPDENSVRVNIRELQTGAATSNVTLRDGDTIFVPRAQSVYIYGQVRSPGAYSIEQGTTVLQALSLAGGLSDRGSSARIRIIRLVDGKKKEVKVKMDDVVAPGDTIVVPERFF